MGGPGSGSKKGRLASRFVDGRWANVEKKRKQLRGTGKIVHHKKPVPRDRRWGNPAGAPNRKLQEMRNFSAVSRSTNTRLGRRNPKKV